MALFGTICFVICSNPQPKIQRHYYDSFELQVEKNKKSVDSRGQFNQLEISPGNGNQESDNVESDIEYNMSKNSVMLNMNTSRILQCLLF